jgi:integrase
MKNLMCYTAEERVQQAILPYLEGNSDFRKITRKKVAELAKIDIFTLQELIPNHQWKKKKDEWLTQRLRNKMDILYESSEIRGDFKICKIIQDTDVREAYFNSLVGSEFLKLAAQLPTKKEVMQKKVLATLERMVEANTPISELTVARLFKESGCKTIIWYGPWLSEPLQTARLELSKRQRSEQKEPADPPLGTDMLEIPGGFVDLNDHVWDLKLRHGLICRDRIRPDVAELAWPILREELRARTLEPSTIRGHFGNFKAVSALLGTEVPDLRNVTLESMQRAWGSYEGSAHQRMTMRSTLLKLVGAILASADDNAALARQEMLSIALWLGVELNIPKPRPRKDFLSEEELNSVTLCCFEDIKTGIEFMKTKPNLLMMSTRSGAEDNALPVVNWAVALIVLVMTVTGLRHQSAVRLKINDWMKIRAGLVALAWRHTKARQDNLAFLPTLVARFLDYYEFCTRELREALGTERLILLGNYHGDFVDSYCEQRVRVRLHEFAQRHNITRNGVHIALNASILRKSYATHQLYEGRNPSFIQAQLGHKQIGTTAEYTQLDRYEHPAQVRNALDAWGEALDLWENPVHLEKLDPDSRTNLFGGGAQDHQKVGLGEVIQMRRWPREDYRHAPPVQNS